MKKDNTSENNFKILAKGFGITFDEASEITADIVKQLKMRNGSTIIFKSVEDKDAGRGNNSKWIEEYNKNHNVSQKIIGDLRRDFYSELETKCTEALKLKGFEFNNKLELEKFVLQRCRCEDNKALKERVYLVDNIPFLLHNYKSEMDIETIKEPLKTTMNASLGFYKFL